MTLSPDSSPPPPEPEAAAPSVLGARRRRLHRALLRGERTYVRPLRTELMSGRQWLDRTIVLTYAALTGLIVVGFTLLTEFAGRLFLGLSHIPYVGPLWALVWTPALTMGVLWWTRRWCPGAGGSGIPQVVRALEDEGLDRRQRSWLVSLRLSLHKVMLVVAGTLAGLSIGREGPTVQVGAGVMNHARRWLSPQSGIDSHDLLVAGAAAGIAAAFNTPLGGIVFALEQLSRRRSMSHNGVIIASIVLAGLVAVSVFGNETYFGRLKVQTVPLTLIGPGLAVALACGLAGGLFSRLLVMSVRGLPDRFSAWRRAHPLRFAGGCGLGVALIGWATGGATAGAGYDPTRALLEGRADLPGIYTLLKFCATWLSAWSGVPAGTFAPSLAIGAGIGHDVARWTGLSGEAAIPLIALGMTGFLAASTRGPITAFIIVMEMVSGQAMVLSLMACALLSTGVARLIGPSMYDEIARLLPVPPAALEAPSASASASGSPLAGEPAPSASGEQPQPPLSSQTPPAP